MIDILVTDDGLALEYKEPFEARSFEVIIV